MADAFSSYKQEWAQIKESVSTLLAKDCKRQKGEQKKATLRRVQSELEEADEIIDQMELEASGKAKLMIQVRTAKAEVKSFRDQVQKESNISDRDALLARPDHQAYEIDVDDSDTYSHSAAQRQRLLASNNTLQSSSSRLDNASRTAAESEAIGGTVLETLRSQGQQLVNARDELLNADGSIAKATGTLKKMVRQMYKNKFLIWGFIIILIAIICLVLWSKFR